VPQPKRHLVRQRTGVLPLAGGGEGGGAILEIAVEGKEAQFYHAETNRDEDGICRGYRLIKIDGLEKTATYDLELTGDGLRCDCPDSTFTDRPGSALGCGCKHAKGLAAALRAANLL
jgi:hypothetical protein